ncbi:MAG: MerR family transcriptional regulator [Actinobacteria bacterium]|nr:MerR family transcriptional regulator [Actinomycetota bacterium]
MDYRVEQLAARAEVSVDTVRFYQARGLLQPPRRQGRVAWYGDHHLERLAEIRRLQARGLSLAAVRRVLCGELDVADEALASAVATPQPAARFTIEELAERSGIPLGLLQALSREGLLVPQRLAGEPRFTTADVEAAAAGLRLLEAGLPLPEILDLARRHHEAMRAVAERAVELFDEHVRHPLRRSGLADEEAAARLVEAFTALLPATTKLVAHHFERTLLAVAQEHIDRVGGEAEVAAVERQVSATP